MFTIPEEELDLNSLPVINYQIIRALLWGAGQQH